MPATLTAPSKAAQTANNLPWLRILDQGRIWAGGKPTAAGLLQLADAGVRSILNLQGLLSRFTGDIDHEALAAALLGLRFIHFPVHQITGPDPAMLERILNVLADPANQPIYLHCRYGRERTNLVLGAYLVNVLGWTPEQAYAEMLHNGFRPFYAYAWRRLCRQSIIRDAA